MGCTRCAAREVKGEGSGKHQDREGEAVAWMGRSGLSEHGLAGADSGYALDYYSARANTAVPASLPDCPPSTALPPPDAHPELQHRWRKQAPTGTAKIRQSSRPELTE